MLGRTTFHFGKAHGAPFSVREGQQLSVFEGSWEPPRTQAFWVQTSRFWVKPVVELERKGFDSFFVHEKDQTLQNQKIGQNPQNESIFKFEWILSTQGLLIIGGGSLF